LGNREESNLDDLVKVTNPMVSKKAPDARRAKTEE
jgi:hypothetical protein